MFKVGDIVKLNNLYFYKHPNTTIFSQLRKCKFKIVGLLPKINTVVLINNIDGDLNRPEYFNMDYIEFDVNYIRKLKLKKLCSK